MRLEVATLKARSDTAWGRKQYWRSPIELCWLYAAPGLNPYSSSYSDGYGSPTHQEPSSSQTLDDQLFDSTMPRAARRHAERIAFEVFPAGRHWAELVEGGAFALGEDSSRKRAVLLMNLEEQIFGAINASNFYLAVSMMCLDAVISGTGLMKVGGSPDPARALSFEPVNQARVAFEGGPRGEVTAFYRRMALSDREIFMLWPEAGISPEHNDTRNRKREVLDATYYDAEAGVWYYDVLIDREGSQQRIVEQDLLVCPWVVWRYSLIPNEVQGYSPTMAALPDARTVNYAKRVRLKSASIRQAGIWTYTGDSVFNPSMFSFEEDALLLPVETNAHDNPTLRPLELAGDTQLNEIVIADVRDQINKLYLVDALPPVTGPVRSATEIAERQREAMVALGSPYLRLSEEVGRPVLRAVAYELARQPGGLEGLEAAIPADAGGNVQPLMLDGTDVGVAFHSPLVTAQQISDAETISRWAGLSRQAAGDAAFEAGAKVEDIPSALGQKLGVPEDLFRDEAERADALTAARGGAPAQPAPEGLPAA